MKASGTPDYVAAFVAKHALRTTPAIETELKAIHWISTPTDLINKGYSQLPEGIDLYVAAQAPFESRWNDPEFERFDPG